MRHSAEVGDSVAGSIERLTKSDLHWLFAAPRCKATLEALDERTLPVDLDTVATAVAKIEAHDESVDQEEVAEIAVSLHHTHLPKMDRLGSSGTIRAKTDRVIADESTVALTIGLAGSVVIPPPLRRPAA